MTNPQPRRLPDWPPRWPELRVALETAFESGHWGRYHSELHAIATDELKQRFAYTEARLCCSGTAAIEWSLRGAGVGPGDEVILSAFDYPGNFRTIELLGAVPVLVDTGEGHPCLDPSYLELARSDRTKAVVASHLFGHAADVDSIVAWCRENDCRFVEDACQVMGMTRRGQPVGTFGDFATLSFGGSKVVTAGSGGAIVINDPRLATRLDGMMDRPSDTFPLSPLQCATLPPQWDRLGELNAHRDQTVQHLVSELSGKTGSWTLLPNHDAQVFPAYYKLAVLATSEAQRNRVVSGSDAFGLPIGAGFRSMHRSSPRRCRRPVPLENAAQLGQRLFLLDHRALMVAQEDQSWLVDQLVALHDQTC